MPGPEASAQQPLSLPYFDLAAGALNGLPGPTAYDQVEMTAGNMPPAIPPLLDEWQMWFYELDADQDGLVTGQDARDFFLKSGLSDDQLFEIWTQADQDQDGALAIHEFENAYRLVQDTLAVSQPAFNQPNAELYDPATQSFPSEVNTPYGPEHAAVVDPVTGVPYTAEPAAATHAFGDPTFADGFSGPDSFPDGGNFPTSEFNDPASFGGTAGDGAAMGSADTFGVPKSDSPFGETGGETVGTKGASPGGNDGVDWDTPTEITTKPRRRKKKSTPKDESDDIDLTFGDLVQTETARKVKKNVSIADSTGAEDLFVSERLKDTETSVLEKVKSSSTGGDNLAEIDDLGQLAKAIRSKLQKSVEVDHSDVRQLLILVEKERGRSKKDAKEVGTLINRKEEFQKELEQLRLELELLKEERRKLDTTRVETAKDCEALQMLILQTKNEIDDFKKDINTLTDRNGFLKSSVLSARQQTEAMDMARKQAVQELESEEAKIKALGNEIEDLKMQADKLRREKEQLQSDSLLLEQQFKDTDQDRHLMLTGLEAQRQRLQTLRAERLALSDDRNGLISASAKLQEWPRVHQNPPMMSGRSIVRDRKGVPNSVAPVEPVLVSPVTTADETRHWERFDSASGPPKSRW